MDQAKSFISKRKKTQKQSKQVKLPRVNKNHKIGSIFFAFVQTPFFTNFNKLELE